MEVYPSRKQLISVLAAKNRVFTVVGIHPSENHPSQDFGPKILDVCPGMGLYPELHCMYSGNLLCTRGRGYVEAMSGTAGKKHFAKMYNMY